jgi:hypothetical protein
MHARSHKLLILLVATSLLIGLCSLFIASWASPAMTPVGLDFVTFTNGPNRERLALFRVTNPHRREILLMTALQVRTNGDWPQGIHPGPLRDVTSLRAHRNTQLSVEVPTNGEIWRLAMVWGFEPNNLDWVRAIVRDNWIAYQNGFPLRGRNVTIGLTGHTNYAEPIRMMPHPAEFREAR